MSDTHLPTDNPVNPSVRYERSDASYKGVVAFGVCLAGICVVSAALLWWMFVAYIRHENTVKRSDLPWNAAEQAGSFREPRTLPGPLQPGTERSGIDPNPRLEGLDPSSPDHDSGRIRVGTAKEQAADEEAYLRGSGWLDRDKGVVHIPIDQAMHKLAGKLPARVDGVAENEFLQAPSRSSSGREPRGGKP